MLSEERNRILTSFSSGTPMGEMLRRYWWPVAFSHDLKSPDVRKVRLLGQDLAIFRYRDGTTHVLSDSCPHRGASMSMGIVENHGLRCPYHGWLFDGKGRCLHQPGEPAESTFRERVRTTAYSAQELGGLIFVYIGPDPVPALPRYDLFCWDDAIRDVGHAVIPCNFVQVLENAVDLDHVAWLHGRYSQWLASRGVADEIPEMFTQINALTAFDRTDYGILLRRMLEGQNPTADDWAVGHPLVFPNLLRLGGGGSYSFHIRVPIDDETTWALWYTAYKPGDRATPGPEPVTSYPVPWRTSDGEFLLNNVEGQDIMAWMTQGKIADRTKEHLGTVDAGVILLRKIIFEQIEAVAAGRDPMNVYRGDAPDIIELPQEHEKFGNGAAYLADVMAATQARFSPRKNEILQRFAMARSTAPLAASQTPVPGLIAPS
ncbi:aromatic ring-hydroxylating dioxygenase subunit alpha [Streptomyces sp. PTM05]|uniref:Aromatic ring-hydroxylating dioxygenase subunit alpha n=1 Tax=Streptantibioticus parmotrematis TaxID=2873249 RepID=A0ABS7QYZ7_9ACTN|nr:aromatic ring-hydroxylating dioxygenase subunit alpha [Streptantibioticus parmotrematis]MBY8887009.1 aromatic ring-hydroxylating dioxygenase subunit alpha [Streptantibioticus parmotrematis]